jgi:hypothetical protein
VIYFVAPHIPTGVLYSLSSTIIIVLFACGSGTVYSDPRTLTFYDRQYRYEIKGQFHNKFKVDFILT